MKRETKEELVEIGITTLRGIAVCSLIVGSLLGIIWGIMELDTHYPSCSNTVTFTSDKQIIIQGV